MQKGRRGNPQRPFDQPLFLIYQKKL
jgi:hypothetical protein